MFEFYKETHTYWVDGELVPCVTDMVSVYGKEDYSSDDAEERIAAATERGTVMHDYIERRLRGEDPADIEIPEEYWPYAEGVELFLEEHVLRPIYIEKAWYGEVDGLTYAGTTDFYGMVNHVEMVLDWKFVSQVDKHKVAAQLGAYARLLAANDKEVWSLGAVQFLPGTYRYYHCTIESALSMFEPCLQLAKAKRVQFNKNSLVRKGELDGYFSKADADPDGD